MFVLHLSPATAIFVVDCCQFGPRWMFWMKNGAYGLFWIYLRYNGAKLSFSWRYMIVSIICNSSEISELHLSRATAIVVVDCCQFGPSWMFGLKMDLMACVNLVGGTTEKISLFSHLKCKYQWYETLTNFLHQTSDVPQPYLLLMAANLAQAGCLGWKWSLWHVPESLAVQRSKSIFFLTLYNSINDV